MNGTQEVPRNRLAAEAAAIISTSINMPGVHKDRAAFTAEWLVPAVTGVP